MHSLLPIVFVLSFPIIAATFWGPEWCVACRWILHLAYALTVGNVTQDEMLDR